MRNRFRQVAAVAAAGLLTTALLAGCGSSGGDSKASSDSTGDSGKTLTIGYSAWPGWFPLEVAQEKGEFAKVGLKVELKYFTDYTASLDAMAAGKVDVNAQTLNDTLFGVAAGSKQTVVVTNDNSTGNDAVICDKSITSVKGLKGKSVGAELGVVDHFLLLQGLDKAGMTEKDIDFKGIKTDAAAAAFANGQFDCVAVFAPFTVQALTRKGSHVLFSSKDFPGTIPDHLVVQSDLVKSRPKDMQKLVDAWYATLADIKADPKGTTPIMAKKAGLSVADYESFADGTTIFSAKKALDAFQDRKGDTTSLPEMARRINPFLVSSGIAKEEAPLDGLLDDSFTAAYVKAHPDED